MLKKVSNKAWFLVLPALALVMFTAIIPLMIVVNYSLLDYLTPTLKVWVGLEWFRDIMHSSRFAASLGRSLLFSMIVITIEIPLGIFIAMHVPKTKFWRPVCLILMALPLMIPWNIIPNIWKLYINPGVGLLGHSLLAMGIVFDLANNVVHTWVLLVMMDIWHWTSLIVFLCYASLTTIPTIKYQAAYIDGATRWSVFKFVELPQIKRVLMMAILLRFMDSFMVFTEVFFFNAGGPGDTTTFLAQDLFEDSVNYNYGPSAARSLIYFIIILIISWIFHTTMTKQKSSKHIHH